MTRKFRDCLLVSIGTLAVLPALAWGQGPLVRFAEFIGLKNPSPPPYGQQQGYNPQQGYAPQQASFNGGNQQRSSEIAVELAWLSDSVTFPYALTAQASENGLQVQGFVPSEAVRQRALYLAKRNSALPVFDGTKMHPGLVAPQQKASPNLPAAASEALRNALPEQSRNLRLNCGNNGNVNVTGTVGNWEDKLAVSQALRQVSGCTSVANGVQVSGGNYGNPQNQRGLFPTPFKNSRSGYGPPDNRPQVNVRNNDPQQRGNYPPQSPMGESMQFGQQPYNPAEADSPYPTANTNTSTEPVNESNWRTSSPTSQTSQTTPVVAATHENLNTIQSSPDNGQNVIARSGESGMQPITTESPYSRQPHEPPLFGDPDPNNSRLNIDQTPAPAPMANSNKMKMPKLPPQQLRQRIENLCGNAVKSVAVENDNAGKLVIRVQLIDGAREQQIIDRIVNMPEMVPYQEQLQLSLELPTPPGQQPQMMNQPPQRR